MTDTGMTDTGDQDFPPASSGQRRRLCAATVRRANPPADLRSTSGGFVTLPYGTQTLRAARSTRPW